MLAATGIECELVPMVTSGDTGATPGVSGVKGLFVAEIVRALQEDEVDLAVHSAKDLPSEDPDGIGVAAVPERSSPFDVLVTRDGSLPEGSMVGSSSLRRRGQLARSRPELKVVEMRGNVDTRLRKLDDEEVDGVMLAEAGLERLGIRPQHLERLPEEEMAPAPGQGALAIQARADGDVWEAIEGIDNAESHAAFEAERRLVELVGGGCALPLGAYASAVEDRLRLRAVVFRPDGSDFLEATAEGSGPEDVAGLVADELFGLGAREILNDLR